MSLLLQDNYQKELSGMLLDKVEYDALVSARHHLIDTLHNNFTTDEREFLLSVKQADPDWKLLGLEGIENLPGVKWKLLNIKRMDKGKHEKQFDALKRSLGF